MSDPLRRAAYQPSPTSLRQKLHMDAAFPGAVEFAEVDALPAAQHQLAALHEDRRTGTDQAGLDVRVAVALTVPEALLLLRHGALQPKEDIMPHVRVGILVDGDGGGGMRAVDDAASLPH